MRFRNFDNDDNLDSIEMFAKEEFSQRLAEYNEKNRPKTDDHIKRIVNEQHRRKIYGIALLVFLVIMISYAGYVIFNFDRLVAEYNIHYLPTDKGRINAFLKIVFVDFFTILPYLLVLIILGVLALLVYFMFKQKNSTKSIDDYLKINPINDGDMLNWQTVKPKVFNPDSFAPANQAPNPYFKPNDYSGEIAAFINFSDESFEPNEFLSWCKKSFTAFWNAWSNGDLEPVRIFLNDDIFEKMRSVLDDQLENNRKEIYKIFSITRCYINKYEREAGFEYLTVYLTSRHFRYVLDTSRNSLIPINGSDKDCIDTIYQLTFLRRFNLDRKTNIHNGIQTVVCPNCGADVIALNAGRCEFCKSVIKVGEFSWVLSGLDEYKMNITPVDNRGVILHTNKF